MKGKRNQYDGKRRKVYCKTRKGKRREQQFLNAHNYGFLSTYTENPLLRCIYHWHRTTTYTFDGKQIVVETRGSSYSSTELFAKVSVSPNSHPGRKFGICCCCC